MINGKISQIKNKNGEVSFPVTTSKAVYMQDGTTTVEKKFEEVNSSLEAIAINVKTFGVNGDGVTDDTIKLQEAIDYCISNECNLYIPNGEYVITNTLNIRIDYSAMWEFKKGLTIRGENSGSTKFLGKLVDKPLIHFFNINNGTSNHAIQFENIHIKPFETVYNQRFDAIKLTNSMGNIFKNVFIEYCKNGFYLTTDNDTSLGNGNTGYCEQNVFEDCDVISCLNCVTFKPGDNDDWNSSYHGNIFERVILGTNGDVSIQDKVVCLNLEGGNVYNCTFNLKCMVSGKDNHIIHFNCESGTNKGNISYECFDDYPTKISTGDNAIAKLFVNGNIYGLGSIGWSDYKPVSVGEINYNDKTVVNSSSGILGRDKIFFDNIIPPKDTTSIAINGKKVEYNPLKNLISDVWSGLTHNIVRYKTTTGSAENGYVFACKEQQGAGSRFIIGTIDILKNSLSDFVPGFEIRSNGTFIKSSTQNATLNFNNERLYRNQDKMIFDNGTVKSILSHQGSIHYPSGMKEMWGSVAVTNGNNTTRVDLTGQYDNAFNVQLTTTNNTGQPLSKNIVMLGGFNSTGFDILTNFENSGTVFWRVIGIKSYN